MGSSSSSSMPSPITTIQTFHKTNTQVKEDVTLPFPFLLETWVAFPGTTPALNIWFRRSTSSRVEALATASRIARASSADAPPTSNK